jgi:hypothetical protein
MSWVALGICAPVLGVVVGFPLQSLVPGLGQPVLNAIWTVLAGLLPLCLGIAITRFRLFDIYIIVRRTLVYTILTVLLGLVYFGGVTLLQRLFTATSGQSSPAALVISTLLIAALFNPLRHRIQGFIDQRFYRRKYDAEKALADFAATARSETDLAQLSARLAGTVQEALQPEQVSLWLKPAADQQRIQPTPDGR